MIFLNVFFLEKLCNLEKLCKTTKFVYILFYKPFYIHVIRVYESNLETLNLKTNLSIHIIKYWI